MTLPLIRRREWDRGFSIAAVNNYSVYVKERSEQFVEALRALSVKGPVDLTAWTTFREHFIPHL